MVYSECCNTQCIPFGTIPSFSPPYFVYYSEYSSSFSLLTIIKTNKLKTQLVHFLLSIFSLLRLDIPFSSGNPHIDLKSLSVSPCVGSLPNNSKDLGKCALHTFCYQVILGQFFTGITGKTDEQKMTQVDSQNRSIFSFTCGRGGFKPTLKQDVSSFVGASNNGTPMNFFTGVVWF